MNPKPTLWRVSVFSIMLLVLANLFGCAPQQAEQAFLPVDETAVAQQLPAHLQDDEEAVIRTRYARYNFPFFQQRLMQKTTDTVLVALFDTVTIALVTDSVGLSDDSVYVWNGTVVADMYGEANIVFNRSSIMASIHVDTLVYEIMPVQDDIVRIRMKDKRKFRDEGPPVEKERRSAPKKRDQGSLDAPSATELVVLVVLPNNPDSILCSTVNKPFLVQLLEKNLNGVFNAFNSTGVTASIKVECYNYLPVGGDLSADLNWVRTNSGVAALRERHKADLVSLFVPSGDYCGRGYLNYPIQLADSSDAFSVVKGRCAIDNFSFAHELGHNLGMRHDRATDGAWSSADCNYGYIYNIYIPPLGNAKARTVMAYGSACNNCPRNGIYSTPQTIHSGGGMTIGPMGVECNTPPSGGSYTRANNRQQLIDAYPIAIQWK